jgi:hypothetical protein
MPDLSQSPNLHQTDGQAIMYMRAQENQSSSYPGVYTDPTAPIAMCEINAIVLQNPDVTSDPVSVQFNRTP